LVIQRDQCLRDRAGPSQPGLEISKLLPVRQIAMQKEERRLLVRDTPRQIFDPIAPVLEASGSVSSLDIGNRGLARNHTFQAGIILFRRRTTHKGTPHNEDQFIRAGPPSPSPFDLDRIGRDDADQFDPYIYGEWIPESTSEANICPSRETPAATCLPFYL